MKQKAFLSLTLATMVGAIAIPTFPTLVQAQTRTQIGDLQQRARGTTIAGKVNNVVGNKFILGDGSGQIIVDAGPPAEGAPPWAGGPNRGTKPPKP